MRRIAAKTVVGLIDGQEEYVQEIAVEPKLVVRG
jgi:DNA-binding LacI/PurR family transcriptional regulator